MIKPDKTNFTSLLPPWISNGKTSVDLVLVGNTFPNGFGNTFSVTLPIQTTSDKVDMYGKNTTTGSKQLLSGSNFPSVYQNKAGELAQMRISYGTNSVTFYLDVTNNTGSSVTLFDQTITISIVEYILPF